MVGQRAREQGMTLVELMVTMVIASIVAASTFMFFAGQQRVYETQTKMLNVQQNAWAAMEVLTRFVRAAGSGMYGCVRPVGGIVPAPPLKRTPAGTNPDDSDDPPVVPGGNLSQPPNAGLRAYDPNSPSHMQRIPPLWIVDQVDPNQPANTGIVSQTDVITVAFGNRSSGTTFDSSLSGGGLTKTTGSIVLPAGNWQMFQANEFIVLVGEPGMGGLASNIGCTLLQVTNSNQANNTLEHATNRWNPGSDVAAMIPDSNGYRALVPPDGYVNTGVRNFGELWWVRFAVVTRLGIPVLTMERLDGSSTSGPQALAEGIEDLQVAFACDLDANGSLSEGQGSAGASDEWILNNPGDVIAMNRGAKCNQPSAVRLTLVARSLTEDNGIDAKLNLNGPPSIENHVHVCCSQSDTTCCDQYRRRVLTTTVYPRNN